ncbi:pilus assembly protein TadB [Enterovibrio norvegicus]|uniref:Tight adherence protein B n=2 Tax=Enterovibrio norvegicus TaxID=188144 RepID=A0A1I5KQL4_9GAMM|nr:type II secretion system F family protein [Enterovibrio norvegicus]OEE47051.1 pilus assembly protein TadB [Enterovibrio norvegicus]OEF56484.1 pilus assembly protein TadB [Enterovibrio norvegicus]OEF62164.1 pilus assembly protein TadB [Enterovibrio norvegicus]SFO86761.1 tight adherence protein B [Enterovibrio norvegicus DSM 15893]
MIANAIYCIFIAFGIYIFFTQSRLKKRRESMLRDNNALPETKFLENRVVDMEALTETTFLQRVKRNIDNTFEDIGSLAVLKVTVFYLVTSAAGVYILQTLFHFNILTSLLITIPAATFFGLRFLRIRTQKAFETNFPDALNMIASSVSAGESLLHAIVFVGDSLDNIVGKEFKRMGERLNMGESTDAVFRKACLRFPTPMFQFFVITMRVNVNRGGQLREVIARLNRVLFDARSIEKKKLSMTAEARMSSYIVCAIPFIFLFGVMQFISPENYDFVMNHPDGRPLLYYVLISEAIGMTIIMLLMRSVK